MCIIFIISLGIFLEIIRLKEYDPHGHITNWEIIIFIPGYGYYGKTKDNFFYAF